jgi:hypothetical protein
VRDELDVQVADDDDADAGTDYRQTRVHFAC